jgi:large subunit ribosomal protein L25
MSSETLEVKMRDTLGSLASRKLRQRGEVPANLYGHGESNVNLSVRADALHNIIKHGTKLLNLTGSVTDTALLREVQWDTFGVDILHVDLTRVSQSEAVEVTLTVELHGEAPGSNEGGQLVFTTHELAIRCPAQNIPEHIQVNIGGLHLGQAIHAGEIALPSGATLLTPANEVVVQVNKPANMTIDDTPASAEPELIRKEKSAEEEA